MIYFITVYQFKNLLSCAPRLYIKGDTSISNLYILQSRNSTSFNIFSPLLIVLQSAVNID